MLFPPFWNDLPTSLNNTSNVSVLLLPKGVPVAQRGNWILWNWSYTWFWALYGFWKLNPDPLEEPKVLFTDDLLLQPHIYLFLGASIFLEFIVRPDWLASELQESNHLYLLMLELHVFVPMPGFYVGSGNWTQTFTFAWWLLYWLDHLSSSYIQSPPQFWRSLYRLYGSQTPCPGYIVLRPHSRWPDAMTPFLWVSLTHESVTWKLIALCWCRDLSCLEEKGFDSHVATR